MWLVNAYIPMAPMIKTILNIAVAIIVVLWLLSIILPGLPRVRIGEVLVLPYYLIGTSA
jgi:hypothetical protein